jgi:hypothetical protein
VPGFLFLATSLAGLGALSIRRLTRRSIILVFIGGAATIWVGIAAHWRLPTAIGLVSTAVTLGILLGQLLPPSSRAVLVTLVVLAGLDLAWIVSGGDLAGGWLEEVATLTVRVGARASSIGTLDLFVSAALATHWLLRGARPWLAVAPGPIGMVLSNVYLALTGTSNLALIPFLLLGWLATEGLNHRFRTGGRVVSIPPAIPGSSQGEGMTKPRSEDGLLVWP